MNLSIVRQQIIIRWSMICTFLGVICIYFTCIHFFFHFHVNFANITITNVSIKIQLIIMWALKLNVFQNRKYWYCKIKMILILLNFICIAFVAFHTKGCRENITMKTLARKQLKECLSLKWTIKESMKLIELEVQYTAIKITVKIQTLCKAHL